jgi:hypothetical protein
VHTKCQPKICRWVYEMGRDQKVKKPKNWKISWFQINFRGLPTNLKIISELPPKIKTFRLPILNPLKMIILEGHPLISKKLVGDPLKFYVSCLQIYFVVIRHADRGRFIARINKIFNGWTPLNFRIFGAVLH